MSNVITIRDNPQACYRSTRLRRASIQRIDLIDRNGDGSPDLQVFALDGRRAGRVTDGEAERDCSVSGPPRLSVPPLRSHRFAFLWTGTRFVAEPEIPDLRTLFPDQ